MALLLKCGAVFLHIPKTGGSWVTHVLNKCNLVERAFGHKHADMDRVLYHPNFLGGRKYLSELIKRRLHPMFQKQYERTNYKFCFVRHPMSWYESWWKYMSGPELRWGHWGDEHNVEKWHPNSILNGLGDDDFNSFVRKVIKKRPGYVTELYGWYTKPGIDFIGKQENLVDDLIFVLNHLNVNFDEDRIRTSARVLASPTPKKPIKWEEDLRKEVERLEYAGIVRYKYLPE